MEKDVLIMTVGKTHSGKTTFARKINDILPNSVVLESDVISVFLRENFPLIHFSSVNREFGRKFDFEKPQLKYAILKTILTFSLENGFRIILSNSNSIKKARAQVIKLIRSYGTKVIMVYFNIPEEVLLKRIKKAGRSTAVLNSSKNFRELLTKKQRVIFEAPNKDEADYFFEIKREKDIPLILDKIRNIGKS